MPPVIKREMKITALDSWYGSNRTLAENVGKLLGDCEWIGVPFAGGMSELKHLKARTMLVSDLHRHIVNLAIVTRDNCKELQQLLDALPATHPDILESAQKRCIEIENRPAIPINAYTQGNLRWAMDFFVCGWMARSATAGTEREFDTGLGVRWIASGGDSAVRFRNATESLAAWSAIFKKCTFVCLDVFDFLAEALERDREGHGLYLDPPFPGPGDKYKHKFNEVKHRDLAQALLVFKYTKIVCRFYDHPLIRELYPEPTWKWYRFTGRKQSNNEAPEVLLANF